MEVPVTVLMPAYNVEKYIKEAIDSVLCQTYRDFEFLIIDDGSIDHTANIVQSYSDTRIKLIQQKNAGVSAALNAGLKIARGKYIARFDADDVCYPTRIEQQIEFMEANPDYVLVGSNADYMSEDGDFLFTQFCPGYLDEEIRDKIERYCPFIHSAVFYKKKVVEEIGGYEVLAYTFEDYFLWKKLIQCGKVRNLNTALIKVRFNPSSVTVDEKDRGLEFTRLKLKALRTGEISPEEGRIMKMNLTSLSADKKESSYHRMLGKKYLWNNYQPKKARKHLITSLKIEPFKLNTFLLLAMSFLPKRWIQKVYNLK